MSLLTLHAGLVAATLYMSKSALVKVFSSSLPPIQARDERLQCAICTYLLNGPLQFPCGHRMCTPCARKLKQDNALSFHCMKRNEMISFSDELYLLRLFGSNLICLNGVKENKQSWVKHVNSVCLLVKNDLNCPSHSLLALYLMYDNEVQITQQHTQSLLIKHRIESSSPYFGVYNYGTVHANFNMIKIRNNRQGHRINDLMYGFDLYIEKNLRKSKNQKINYCKRYLSESVTDTKNDTHCKIITNCPASMHTGLHTSYRLRHFSVSDKFLASFNEEYCTLGEESRSCSSEGFTPIDCSDTSTSQLTTMPITVLLEDTVYQLFSVSTVVFEDSQKRISHHAEDAVGTKDDNEKSSSIKTDEEMFLFGPIQETDDTTIS